MKPQDKGEVLIPLPCHIVHYPYTITLSHFTNMKPQDKGEALIPLPCHITLYHYLILPCHIAVHAMWKLSIECFLHRALAYLLA